MVIVIIQRWTDADLNWLDRLRCPRHGPEGPHGLSREDVGCEGALSSSPFKSVSTVWCSGLSVSIHALVSLLTFCAHNTLAFSHTYLKLKKYILLFLLYTKWELQS